MQQMKRLTSKGEKKTKIAKVFSPSPSGQVWLATPLLDGETLKHEMKL